MRKSDFAEFSQLLGDTYALLGREKAPNATATALFFRALGVHAIEDVRAGFEAHIKDPVRGRFAPMPATAPRGSNASTRLRARSPRRRWSKHSGSASKSRIQSCATSAIKAFHKGQIPGR